MVKNSQIDVEPEHLALIKKILKRHIAYKTVWAYGSRVNWTANQHSDLDLVVFDVDIVKLGELKEEFAESDLPFSVDIMSWEKIPENFKSKIREKYVVLQQKPELDGWEEDCLDNIAFVNPTESLSKGVKAKKIAMENLLPFTKKVPCYSIDNYNGGMKFRNGDTLVARITPCLENGKTAYVDILDDKEVGFGSTEFIVLRKKKDLSDKRFLYYFAISPDFRDVAIISMTGSSGRQRVQTDVVKKHYFIFPPLPEQKAIASVLSSLDDKIDLLHRQNKTLETMAETLFMQWFVEEAKDDWEEDELGQVVETTSGGTPSRKKMEYYDNGFYPWVKSKELTGSFITATEESITEEALKNSSAKLLPKNSILIAMYGATVGEYAIIAKEMTCNQAICALKPNDQYPYTFLFMLAKYMKQEIINMAIGSAQQNISQLLIKKLPVPKHNNRIMEYHKLINPSFEKMKFNIYQIRTLEKLRDILLPKLMSGEVRIS